MKAFVTVLLVLGVTLALLPPKVDILPDSEVNTPEFYQKLGFFPPELDDTGKAGQVTIDLDTSAYWHFPSKDGNKNAPVVLCVAMGPGIPSFMELAGGLGPFKSVVYVPSRNQYWKNNSYSLNMNADVVFIDMMKKGGYSRFVSTKGQSIEKQNKSKRKARYILRTTRYKAKEKQDQRRKL